MTPRIPDLGTAAPVPVASLLRRRDRRRPSFRAGGLGALAGCLGALVLLLLLFAPSAHAACANEGLRTEDNSLNLPDCRAYELVSPADKNGGAVQGFGQNSGGDVLQAAADGEAATFSSAASFGAAPQGAPPAGQYIAHRTEGVGWQTENITTAAVSGSYGDHPDGVPYRLFAPDLARGVMLNGERCRGSGSDCPVANPPLPGSGAPPGYQDYYLRDSATGAFQALVTDADAQLGIGPASFELAFAGAGPDLDHIVLSTCAALASQATEVHEGEGCSASEPNLYEWSGGELALVNLLPGEAHGTPGAHLAAQSGAISVDGSRIYFSDGEDSPLYLREAGQTKLVPETGGGGAAFQTASADGSVAYFLKGGDLYRYGAATDITAPPLASEVTGVLGASEDGSHVYYATPTGVFLWNAGQVTRVASGPADPGDFPPDTGTARVSADGATLAFLATASLTGYDNTDQHTSEPDSEVYLYSAASGNLSCASCNPKGTPPVGPSTIPGAVADGSTRIYKPRDLSASGTRLFFDSRDVLAAKDSNTHQDVYQWEAQGTGTCQTAGGCIGLISGGQGAADAEFIDASADGRDAFFLTDSSLVAQDPGSIDIYDAREGGGFPAPPTPIECDGDTCQPLPPEPEDPALGTATPGAEGNPPPHFPKEKATKHHKRHRRHKKHHRRHRKKARHHRRSSK